MNVAFESKCPIGKGDYYPEVQYKVFLPLQVDIRLEKDLEHVTPLPPSPTPRVDTAIYPPKII